MYLPRKARCNNTSNYSHVIVQGINKSYIFNDKYLKKLYLNLLKKNLIETNIEILSYCIMGNHAHILIYSEGTKDLTSFMHKVNTTFAIKYNKVQNRVGYVFKDRFYVQPILSEHQLYNCLVYIHRNPIKANLVSKFEDYEFSSYKEFYGKMRMITDRGIKLIFRTSTNYIDIFEKIHKKTAIEDIEDIIEFIDENIVISNFLKLYKKSMEEVKQDRKQLKMLLIKLKNESGLSLRKMGQIFDMGKDTINKIIKG